MSYYYAPKLTQSEAERIGRIERRHPDPTLPGPDEPANLEHAEIAHARIHKRAEAFIQEDILCCDSWLIPMMEAAGEDGFTIDDWENVCPDPSDWSLDECREWLDDGGHDYPCSPLNPWEMDRAALVTSLENDWGTPCYDSHTLLDLSEMLAECVTSVDDWRAAVRDQADPAEPYEWWRVSKWLCERLRDAGEVVIDNGHGHWWGRCCTGQSIILDGTIQRIAHGLLASR